MKQNKGFTLIEVMVVVAILGILVSMSISYYRSYVATSQVSAALTELQGIKLKYEQSMNDGEQNSSFDVTNPKFSINSNICDFVVYQPVLGISEPAVTCRLKNVSTLILGESIILSRELSGEWKCSTSTDFNINYKPQICQ